MYLLEKISDNVFNGFHPNGYDVGFISKGLAPFGEPRVGHPFIFARENYKGMRTSLVIEEMDENGIFKTSNSTYRLTKIEEENLNKSE